MRIHAVCKSCGQTMQAPDHFAGCRVVCPHCSGEVQLPPPGEVIAEEIIEAEAVPLDECAGQAKNPWDIPLLEPLHEPQPVERFLEAPRGDTKPASTTEAGPDAGQGDWAKRMFAALLDPRSIQWLLAMGGGLMVLGGLIWLISWGALEHPLVAATVLGAGSLGVLGAGWLVVLKTRFHLAGQALTFLGCVVVSLNLWFYHAQGLLLLDQGLWMAGVVCVLLYAATVWVLRDPLFLYAVEAGVTLTAVLLLGNFGLASHATELSVVLMVLAMISIHACQAFPAQAETFSRSRFGLPLFWCGQVQLAAALCVLAGTQLGGNIVALGNWFELPADGVPLTNSRWVPGMLWLAGAYAYGFSDLVVRRIGLYTYLAAVSLVMAECTLIGFDLLGTEGLIATLALTATAVSLLSMLVQPTEERFARAVPPLALLLSVVPVGLGLVLHVAATSLIAGELGLRRETSWVFVGVMLLVAAASRVSAYVYQNRSPSLAAVYLFFAAGSLIVAAAGLLRELGQTVWSAQVPWLLVIPAGYLIASRWSPWPTTQRPLRWIAQTATAVILVHVAFGGLVTFVRSRGFEPAVHLSLALILAETAGFYALARALRGRPANSYLAVAAGCAAIWQLMSFWRLPDELFTIVFALLGLVLLAAAKLLGLHDDQVWDASGRPRTVKAGRGAAVWQSGHAVLCLTMLIALLKGAAHLAAVGLENRSLTAYDWAVPILMTAAALTGMVTSGHGAWRRLYAVSSVLFGGLTILTLNVALDISVARKLEILSVAAGVIMLGAAYVGRFLDEDRRRLDDLVTLGLWLGSLLACLPLLLAVFVHWGQAWEFAPWYDELALIVVTLVLLATGVVWRVKASTLLGGGTLLSYLVVLIASMLYRPQLAVGIYLAGGGAVLFGLGILLAVYRDYLVALPDRVAKREGVFRVISWR